MSDLISRSELLKSFQRCYSGHLGMENSDFMMTFKSICKIINQQPTTYDIDKVVEELEEMIHPKQLYFCKYARGGCKHLDNDDKDCMECVVENAIEIVKQGAVSDDVCEWRKHSICGFYSEHVGAVRIINIADGYKYCPYCGKKIKIVGD